MKHSYAILAAAMAAAAFSASCAKPAMPTETEWNAIEQLETQAKAIARVDGCASSGDCRSAPVGSRACGGPRYYIPWCAKTTDSAALYRKLAEVARAEQEYNRKHNTVSTCEFRTAPLVESVGGSCVAR
ncbi:MAG: hypothetical protein Q7S20_03840 [Gemmatimonadaceae bacterium]|nr:hypothetical protein [Gemmatimonadaceae bacterium]